MSFEIVFDHLGKFVNFRAIDSRPTDRQQIILWLVINSKYYEYTKPCIDSTIKISQSQSHQQIITSWRLLLLLLESDSKKALHSWSPACFKCSANTGFQFVSRQHFNFEKIMLEREYLLFLRSYQFYVRKHIENSCQSQFWNKFDFIPFRNLA